MARPASSRASSPSPSSPWRSYLDDNPKGELAPHALAYLADAYHRLGQEEASQAALDRLAREWPESEDLVRLRVRLGEEALKADQAERAVALLSTGC